ncbi:MAG: topoisomerase IV [Ruminococcaceae bacterium]|nr:topoisomerase IV [Oscillospiraceae bacterium]
MAPKKPKKNAQKQEEINPNAHILGAGDVVNQPIVETLEINYMPYAMSVIMSRALPEIDGFKPSHRKLLYTMYKMGLLTGPRIKSANIVGRTMQLNPHGDAAIYETMVRLARGNESLLHPFIDSKGNFGKAYSSGMVYAASRYTEAKLEAIAAELFRDIDKDTVDFVDNYDSTMKEPTLLPVTFPSILINNNEGIAVGMACKICSFNLNEVCKATIELIKDNNFDVLDIIEAPDFPGGGQIIYDRDSMREILSTGRGSIPVRAKYRYDKKNNCIEIYEIPYTTTAETIIEKIIEKSKTDFKEISDIRDETDKSGLKIAIDLKRGTDVEKLMARLYNQTPLESAFACNFNVLIGGAPQVLGVKDLLLEWIAYRTECVKRRVFFDVTRAQKKLHLLQGLEKILLDIDKAIKIVRETNEESEVVPNLMIGFGIDEIQAEFVAEIKLRHLNREYILKRLQDVKDLEAAIKDMQETLESKNKIKKIIINELKDVMQKYGQPRKSEIICAVAIEEEEELILEEIEDYALTIFFSKAGYFKKITPQSLRMSGEQKVKEGDEIVQIVESSNINELLFFTDKCQVYKSKVSDFLDSKASLLGDYIPTILEFDEGEEPIYMAVTDDYKGYMLFFFENGKVAKVDMSAYETKTNRKKLIKAYGAKSPIVAALYIREDQELVLTSSSGRMLLFNTAVIMPKTTKDTIGVSVMTMKKGQRLMGIRPYVEGEFAKPHRYRTKNLPALGSMPSAEDTAGEQLTL